jgi:hypothetical protein
LQKLDQEEPKVGVAGKTVYERRKRRMEIKDIIYFDEPGPANTDEILKQARARVETLGIRHVVIAAQTGVSVRRFLDIAGDLKLNIVAVTNPKGGSMPIAVLYTKYEKSKKMKQEYAKKGIVKLDGSISDEGREDFEKHGVQVCHIRDILGIGGRGSDELRDVKSKLNPFMARHLRPLDIEAGSDLSLLNIVSMGFRVLVGITVVAVDRGLVPEGETVLSIAGTGFAGGGADTAAVLRAGRTAKGCLVKEILGFPKQK